MGNTAVFFFISHLFLFAAIAVTVCTRRSTSNTKSFSVPGDHKGGTDSLALALLLPALPQ